MNCFICSNPTTDNTHIILPLDNGQKVDVYLCDDHADTSLRKLKELYSKKVNELEELIKKAKELGYNLNIDNATTPKDTQPKIIAATIEPKQPAQDPKPISKEPTVIKSSNTSNYPEDTEMISTEIIDKKSMRSVGGSTDMGSVASYQSYDFGNLADKLPENARAGKVKMTMVEGRGGQPIAIPQKRMDGLGETHINIIKSENDEKLQARFKKMATDSVHDRHANFAQSGYAETTRSCPICGGGGTIRQNKNDISCPKCGGGGMISIG